MSSVVGDIIGWVLGIGFIAGVVLFFSSGLALSMLMIGAGVHQLWRFLRGRSILLAAPAWLLATAALAGAVWLFAPFATAVPSMLGLWAIAPVVIATLGCIAALVWDDVF